MLAGATAGSDKLKLAVMMSNLKLNCQLKLVFLSNGEHRKLKRDFPQTKS